MQNFKELKVWEKSHILTLAVYELTKNFPEDEKFALVSQLRRATSSIPMNIAEGCGRNSNKELVHFLYIGIGSASEVEYTLLLCHDLNYIDNEKYLELSLLLDEIKKMLYSLIKTIKPSTN